MNIRTNEDQANISRCFMVSVIWRANYFRWRLYQANIRIRLETQPQV